MAVGNDVDSIAFWEDQKRRANAVFNSPSDGDAKRRQAHQAIRHADQQIRRLKLMKTAALGEEPKKPEPGGR